MKGERNAYKVKSCTLYGINGYLVDVEVDLSEGLLDLICRLARLFNSRSKDRVRAAIKNSQLLFPIKRITVNLAPADTKRRVSFRPSYCYWNY